MQSPQGSAIGSRRGRSSTSAPTTTSAWPTHPDAGRRRPGRRSTARATAWPRCASSAARRTIHKELERRSPTFLGTDDAILYSSLLRRQRRAVRDAARRGGRGHLRRAQPRLDHRRRAAVQGEALSLRQQRHGRPRGQLKAPTPRRALQADRHRRRVLDGRLSSPSCRRSAIWPTSHDALVWSTTRTPSASSGATRPRHARALRRRRARRHPHRHPRQGAGRRHAAASRAAARRSSSCCASARAPICSPTRSRPRSPRPRWRCSSCSRRATALREQPARPTPRTSASRWQRRLRPVPGPSTRSFR